MKRKKKSKSIRQKRIEVKPMAKRRKAKRSYFAARTKRRSYSRSKGSSNVVMKLAAAGAYGAVREKLSNALTPITSKVPLGTIADEAVILGLAYFAQKKVSNPIVKDVAHAAMIIESARIGEALANGSAFGNTQTTSSQYTY